jgi:hypothetical protein
VGANRPDLGKPRPGFTQHPLTIRAVAHMVDLAERATHFRDLEPRLPSAPHSVSCGRQSARQVSAGQDCGDSQRAANLPEAHSSMCYELRADVRRSQRSPIGGTYS